MSKLNLKRDVAVIVSIKVLLVVSAAIFVFGPKQRPRLDGASIRDFMLRDAIPNQESVSR